MILSLSGAVSSTQAIKAAALNRYCKTFLFFCCVVGVFFANRANAEAAHDVSGAPPKTVRVGMFARDGYHNYSGDKPVSGYGFDYIQTLRAYTNWKYQYSDKQYKWADMLGLLESGRIDMVSCVIKTPEREAKFAFSKEPMGEATEIMTVKAGRTQFKSGDYAHWNGIRVGILKNSIWYGRFAQFAKEKGFVFEPVFYGEIDEMSRDLQAEKHIDAAVTNDIRPLKNEWIFERLGTFEFYIAVRKSDKALLAEIDAAMAALDAIDPKLRNSLREKYYYAAATSPIEFTDAEREFIRQMRESGRVLRAIINPDRKPISYFDDGEYRGALKDIADEIIKRTGLPFEFVPSRDRQEYYHKIYEHPEVDLVFDFAHDFSKAEKFGFRLTKPYFSTSTSILHRKGLAANFKRFAYVEPSNEPNCLNAFFAADATSLKCQTIGEAIAQIASGECDAMYLHTRAAEYAARSDLRGRLSVLFMPNLETEYCAALRESHNPLLFSILNKAVDTVDERLLNIAYFHNSAPIESSWTFYRAITENPVAVLLGAGGILFAMLLVLCYVLRSRRLLKRRHSEIRTEIARWDALSKIANIYRFQFNYKTREMSGNMPADIWPTVNGVAVPVEGWVYAEDVAQWRKFHGELVENKRREFTLTHRLLQNGKMRHILVYMRKERDDSDIITGIAQEVTDIVETRERRNAAMRLWQTCIDSVPFMMFVKSAKDFRLLQCNESYAQFFNKTPAEVVGKTDAELFGYFSDFVEKFAQTDRAVVAEGKLRKIHEMGIDHEGNLRHIMTVKIPVRNVDGEPILICMSADETEAVTRNQKLQNLLEARDAAAELAHVVTYQINYKTWEISGSKKLEEFWEIKDGLALRASAVVHPEDVDVCVEKYNAVASGKLSESIINFRRTKGDGLHYYRLYMRKDPALEDTITGIIIDTTEFVEEQKKCEALTRLWNSVADAIPAILFVKDVDDDYRYLYANKNLANMLKTSVENIVGHCEKEFLRPSDAARINKSDIAAANSGKVFECYELVRDANGVDHHYRSIKIPSVNEFGHRIMIQMTTDVTELQELSEVRKIVSSAFESLFFTENLERGICGILKQVCEFVGFTRGFVCCIDEEQNQVRLCATYVPNTETSMFNDRKFAIGDVADQEWYKNILTSKRGDVFDCDFSDDAESERARVLFPKICELKDRFDVRGVHVQYLEVNGKPWGYVGFLTQYADPKRISENEKSLLSMAANIIELAFTRKRSFVNLQNAMEDAKAAAEVKSNFLAIMSHEIRTPLNAVLGFAELLKDPHLDPEAHKSYLKNISDAGNILLALINDILDLSKLSASKMKFTPTESSLLTLVSQIGLFFQPKCRAKGIRLMCAVPSDFPKIWIDKSRIRQILFNLIGNAVKFTAKGAVDVSAEFERESEEIGTFRIKVADTGTGISEDDLNTLFQPFTQANAIRGQATANNGTGLGLVICKKMLECMGGSISVASECGKGAVFTAELRNVKYRAEANAAQDKPASIWERPQLKDYSRLSVLIVDDVKINLILLEVMLKKMKISAVKAESAETAMDALAKQKFDYVLTDLWMPGLNGAELARQIRHDYKDAAPRIALLTADVEGKEHFDFAAFDAVLTKPVTALSVQRFFDEK